MHLPRRWIFTAKNAANRNKLGQHVWSNVFFVVSFYYPVSQELRS